MGVGLKKDGAEEHIGPLCNFGRGLKCCPINTQGRFHPHPRKNKAKYESKSLEKEN